MLDVRQQVQTNAASPELEAILQATGAKRYSAKSVRGSCESTPLPISGRVACPATYLRDLANHS